MLVSRFPMRHDSHVNILRSITAGLLGACLLGAGGCRSLEFYEQGRLRDGVMSFDEDPAHVHFVQKCRYSREAAIGGIGATAGGGCGCY